MTVPRQQPLLVSVYTSLPELIVRQRYADGFELHIVDTPPAALSGFALWLDPQGLALLGPQLNKPFRLPSAAVQARLGNRTGLVRACGQSGKRILDPFAGFCIDGLTLAAQGFQVTASEWNPLVYALAAEFVQQFNYPLELRLADAGQVLQLAAANCQQWDVIYLDPMFPPRRSKALPGLAAQVLQNVCANADQAGGIDEQSLTGIVELALQCAPRVVLKRRRKERLLRVANRPEPTHQYSGRSVRFDVYLSH